MLPSVSVYLLRSMAVVDQTITAVESKASNPNIQAVINVYHHHLPVASHRAIELEPLQPSLALVLLNSREDAAASR